MLRKTSIALCLGTSLALVLAACGSSKSSTKSPSSSASTSDAASAKWQAVVDAANKEGKVVLYTNSDSVNAAFAAAWHKSYPNIELVPTHYSSGDLTAKLDAEKGGGVSGADVATLSSNAWLAANVDHLVAPTGPALAKYWSGSKYVTNTGKSVLVGATPLGIGVNTDQLKKLGVTINSYADLLQPKLKGALGLYAGNPSPAAYQWWYAVVQTMGGDAGVQTLADMKPRIYTGTVPLATDIASGEVAVGAVEVKAAITTLAAKGAPVQYITPSPVVSTPVISTIAAWASHPNAAQVFENWLMSPEGQIALNGDGSVWSPLPLSELGSNVPTTMKQIPADGQVVDGVLTPDQNTWVKNVWLAKLKLG